MKEIHIYVCEICNRDFIVKSQALDCERQGIELPLYRRGDKVLFKLNSDREETRKGFVIKVDTGLTPVHAEKHKRFISYDIIFADSPHGSRDETPEYDIIGNILANRKVIVPKEPKRVRNWKEYQGAIHVDLTLGQWLDMEFVKFCGPLETRHAT
ncbi:MAG: hypothetical protein Q8L47_03805 [bacterium]|nr:hypothetical protein [bacterium]